MIRTLYVAALLLSAGAMLLFSHPDAEGCGIARRPNSPSISIAEESALIVWDPVKKVQHFIRRAAFDTKSPDFGFLVPTPGPDIPTLKEVEDGIFRAMDRWMLPKIVEQTKWKFDPMSCMFGCMTSAPSKVGMAAKDGVRVIHEQKVGGYEVNVLEADHPDELSEWLKKNGYSNDPELQSWLFPYVAAKWRITAFKITQDPKTGQLATTKPVRMSFKTDRPFFPYREPEGKKEPGKEKDWPPTAGRLLRVFFVADSRMAGKLGNAAWHADVKWSDSLSDEQRKQLVKETGVPEDELPGKAWLTTFEDHASPRPGKEEVYFDPAQDRTPIVPPPFIQFNEVWVPFDVIVLGVLFLVLACLAIQRVGWKTILPTGNPQHPEAPKGPPYDPWSAS